MEGILFIIFGVGWLLLAHYLWRKEHGRNRS